MSINAMLKQSTSNANILQAKTFRPALKRNSNANQPKKFISNNNISKNNENEANSQNVSVYLKEEKPVSRKSCAENPELLKRPTIDDKPFESEAQRSSIASIASEALDLSMNKKKKKEKENKKEKEKEKSKEKETDSPCSSSVNLNNLITNLNLKNKFTKEEYRQIETKYLREEYSSSILATLFEDESVNADFLAKHKITDRMRSRMIDWMIEVLTNYNCTEETFFISVAIMDKFCQLNPHCLQPNDLHLIGIASMFLASKYQDIYPLRLKIIYNNIAHKKCSCNEIKAKENEISKCLNYVFTFPNMWDFISVFIEEIFVEKFNQYMITNKTIIENYYPNKDSDKKDIILEKLYNKHMIILLKLVCVYLAKMNCHDYNLIGQKQSLLAASSIYVGVKICEQINKEDYITDYFTNRLSEVSTYTENEIIKCSQKILSNAQNFDTLFPNLENLKKVHFKPIIEFKQRK